MPVPHLSAVPTDLPEPPYAEDTRVRGWKFEIDHERLQQSDTWALAPPDMRPWLLMLWLTSWQQMPAGSMPDDDEIIAAKIGMDQRLFTAHRDILMRGWRKHSDGRMYHGVIVEQVQNWQQHNKRERERVARWRESKKSNACVTRNKHVSTTPEPEPEPVINDADASCAKTASVLPRRTAPYVEIWKLWCEKMPELPRPHHPDHWTDARKKKIRTLWHNQLPDMEAWEKTFDIVRRSRFLMGQAPACGGRAKPFQADLWWITKPENLLKIYEGKYRDR